MNSQPFHTGRAAAPLALALAACVALSAPALAQQAGRPTEAQIAAAKAVPTPRAPDGKPDLTGFWSVNTEFGSATTLRSEDGKKLEFQIPPPFEPRAPRAPGAGPARPEEATPPYKPEHLAKVKALAVTDVDTDPSFVCNPNGTPRAGAPTEIFQSKDAIALLYAGGQRADYRVIPTSGGQHDPNADPSWLGDSVGRWEGDTLVVDTVNLTEDSWLGSGGWFHTDALHVVERFTRQGNALLYEAVVEDPGVLSRPWNVPPRTLVLGKAGDHAEEIPPCHERDQEHMVDKYHITP